jgi:L-malate glycosyltransferase
VDYILCNHEAIQELLEKQPIFRKGKAITIHKGHDLSWYKDVLPIDLRELGIPEDAFVCTCVANARRMKGIKYLVEAMKYLPDDLPIHLILAGRGLASKDIMKIVISLPNRDHIHFPGFRKDGLEIVKASDIFVLASIKGESITKAVIEAMCLGKTPVITRIPGNRDLIIHKESGLMVPPKDPKAIAEAILTLYQDRSLCQQLGQNARHRIDTLLNARRTADEYYKFLCRISE